MGPSKDDTITTEVGSRLDELFGDDDDFDMPGAKSASKPEGPITEDLKTIIKSIDRKITDSIMRAFTAETSQLKKIWKNDKILIMFLKLLESIGNYVRTKGSETHPDSIKLLHSVFDRLEKIVLSQGMTEAKRQKLLSDEVKKFKKMKEYMESASPAMRVEPAAAPKPEPVNEPEPVPEPEPNPAMGQLDNEPALEKRTEQASPVASSKPDTMTPHEAFSFALRELKDVIQAEFKALRAEVILWRKGQ